MIQLLKMAEGRLIFEQQQLILEWYWKFKIGREVQSLWTRETETARHQNRQQFKSCAKKWYSLRSCPNSSFGVFLSVTCS
jgi:hypothetical protein